MSEWDGSRGPTRDDKEVAALDINQFKIALEVKSKEIEGLKKEKKGKINKSMLEPNNLLKYILARVKVSG